MATSPPTDSGGAAPQGPAGDDIVRQAVEAEETHGGGVAAAAPPPAGPPPAERKFFLDNLGVRIFAFVVIGVFVILVAVFLFNAFRGEGGGGAAGMLLW